jgi:Restriction endonuclease
MIDPAGIRAELAAIRASNEADEKGRRLEGLIAGIFNSIAGMSLEAQDVESDYGTEEIDLYFWNNRERDGLHFLDCPLLVECKGWSGPVSGNVLRYFATTLKDRGRSNGIFIALEGITGKAAKLTNSFYHTAAAMADGQTVLVVTGADLEAITDAADLVTLLRRRMLDQVRGQVVAIEGRAIKAARRRAAS